MVIECLHCHAILGEPCCGGAVYQLRFFECERCHSIVPNPRWSRLSIIDGYGNSVIFKCIGCEEDIRINDWVFKRDEQGVGEYSCPKCGKVWGRG